MKKKFFFNSKNSRISWQRYCLKRSARDSCSRYTSSYLNYRKARAWGIVDAVLNVYCTSPTDTQTRSLLLIDIISYASTKSGTDALTFTHFDKTNVQFFSPIFHFSFDSIIILSFTRWTYSFFSCFFLLSIPLL